MGLTQPFLFVNSWTGYALEYAPGYYVTSRSVFTRILIDGDIPSATIEDLQGDETYHVRVAPRFGRGIGRFSDPPDAFLTLAVPVAGKYKFRGHNWVYFAHIYAVTHC